MFGADPNSVQVAVGGTGYALSADGKALGQLEVTVEGRDPKIPGELGWAPALAPALLAAQRLSNGDMLWRGAITLPGPRGVQPLRLVLREYEVMPGGRRLTYTDVVPL